MAVGLLVLAPAAALANEYVVTSCTDPGGQPNAAAGWDAGSANGGTTANTCATAGGALRAVVPFIPGNPTAGWRFTAPVGTRIVRITAERATQGFTGTPADTDDLIYAMSTQDQTLERCETRRDTECKGDVTGTLDKQGLSGTFLEFRLLCADIARACSRAASVDAKRLYVALQDAALPAVSNSHVIDDGDSSGVLRIGYDAQDTGGGLYRTLVKVDGKIAQTTALAPAPCADVNTADTDAYQFNVPVPCPLSLRALEAAVDAKSLTPGPHGVELAVEDAAGNQTAVFGPVEFPKLNVLTGSSVPQADLVKGRLRMWFVKARNRGRSYTSRLGTRVVTRGVLTTPSGKGIQGARVDVYHVRKGKRRLIKTGLKSREGGKLTLILPLNVDTRQIQYTYRALRPGPITSRATLRLNVRTRSGRLYHRKSRT